MQELNRFSTKTLYEAIQVMHHFQGKTMEEAGSAIEKHIISTRPDIGKGTPKLSRPLCPSCKVPLVGPYEIDNIEILRCAKKCGYSVPTYRVV